MKRYAPITLVFIVLLVNILMRHCADANPLTDMTMWKLRQALPAGVLGATLCIALPGMGAMIWRGALRACGAAYSPQAVWGRLIMSSLWGGWLPLLCAAIFYTASTGNEDADGAMRVLIGCFVAMMVGRILSSTFRHALVGIVASLIAATCAILCGSILLNSPMCTPAAAMAAGTACCLLLQRDGTPQMAWLHVTALAVCAYAAAFGHLLASYLPALPEAQPPAPGMEAAAIFAALAVATAAAAPLRRSLWGRRVSGAAALAAVTVWIYMHLHTAEQPLTAACFGGALLLFSLPTALFMRGLFAGSATGPRA